MSRGRKGNFDEHGRVCTICKTYKPWNEFYNTRRRPNGKDATCKVCSNKNSKRLLLNVKKDVITKYGGCCACCGETEILFLTLDHINNDGAEHRKLIGKSSGSKMWYWARDNGYPDILQILCFNCNCGKQINGGMCPHER